MITTAHHCTKRIELFNPFLRKDEEIIGLTRLKFSHITQSQSQDNSSRYHLRNETVNTVLKALQCQKRNSTHFTIFF
jgi:hypothetical protein